MRKVLFLASVLAVIAMSANAQSTFEKGTKLVKVGAGINSNGIPFTVGVEFGVKNDLFGVEKLNLGVGGYFGFYGYSTSTSAYGATIKTSTLVLGPGVTANLHYQLIEKLDFYAGLSLGVSLSSATVNSNSSSTTTFAWGLAAGLRYELTPKFGIFLEGGKGAGFANLGVAYKF